MFALVCRQFRVRLGIAAFGAQLLDLRQPALRIAAPGRRGRRRAARAGVPRGLGFMFVLDDSTSLDLD